MTFIDDIGILLGELHEHAIRTERRLLVGAGLLLPFAGIE